MMQAKRKQKRGETERKDREETFGKLCSNCESFKKKGFEDEKLIHRSI